MKNIAIITDIHGNSPALRAVLGDIRNRDIEHIYCLGDLVGIGPDSKEVIELLRGQDNMSFVQGNHDQAVVAAFYDREVPKGHEHVRAHHKWLAERMDEDHVRFLESLPLRIDRDGCLFVHYHLDQHNHFLPIDQNPTGDKLDLLYKDEAMRLVCFGHHHIVHDFIMPKAVYFNPGSLGCNYKPEARYGVVQISKQGIKTQVIEVPYENSQFLRSYRELGVLDSEFILKVFHGGQI